MGLIMCVGIAWVAAVSLSKRYYGGPQYRSSERNEQKWVYFGTKGLTWEIVQRYADSSNVYYSVETGPWWSGVCHEPSVEDVQKRLCYKEDAWGFPMLCMVSERRKPTLGGTYTILSGIPGRNWFLGSDYILPIRPIWFGLFVNTFVYSIIIWFGFSGRVLLRNAIRRKRGLCT
jgi:hypothetical protein